MLPSSMPPSSMNSMPPPSMPPSSVPLTSLNSMSLNSMPPTSMPPSSVPPTSVHPSSVPPISVGPPGFQRPYYPQNPLNPPSITSERIEQNSTQSSSSFGQTKKRGTIEQFRNFTFDVEKIMYQTDESLLPLFSNQSDDQAA
mmetsp:Transcript_7868/g.10531  ORF Transcript_7868/g.10531 Transcript_7868/m.10531 type:complete len:142 (-) Transcript_7868:51-476(-)